MTAEELRQLDRYWAEGLALKQIARAMGYTKEHLGFVMRGDRGRWPRRTPRFTDAERDMWAGRVLSGELTARQAAELAGCGPSAVRKWARERRAS